MIINVGKKEEDEEEEEEDDDEEECDNDGGDSHNLHFSLHAGAINNNYCYCTTWIMDDYCLPLLHVVYVYSCSI